jgi:hypothetical protein
MLSLLSETAVTPATLIDLVGGALREWARALTRQPSTPVSLKRELWRDLVRSLGSATAMSGGTWLLSLALSKRGIRIPNGADMLGLVSNAVFVRVGIVFVRRFWMHYRATMAFQAVSPEALISPGLGRTEFWCWISLIAVASTMQWTGGGYWRWLPMLWISVDWLRGTTKPELVRRGQVQQLAIQRHQLAHGRAAAAVNVTPWL